MRRLMQRASTVDAETELSLRIIDRFDRLVADRASIDVLCAHAAEVTGRSVGVDEWLTGAQLVHGASGAHVDDAARHVRAVHAAAISARLRGRLATSLELGDGRTVLAASVEQAAGRSGVAWADGAGMEAWSIADQIAVERLALAVSARALEEHDRTSAREPASAPLHVLLSEPCGLEPARQLARQAGLDPLASLVVAVVCDRPRGTHSPETLLATVLRRMAEASVPARAALVDGEVVVVTDGTTAWRPTLERVARDVDGQGWSIHIGASERSRADELTLAIAQARQALLLGTLLGGTSGVTESADLGILRLLASIPSEQARRDEDFKRIEALDGSSAGVTDLELLATYCDTGSLRKTAERLFLHHTSVHYRVKRLERVLGFDLSSSRGRMRALLAVRLLQIDRLRR